jgi:nicotinate-nucleotide adenylyltransferase
VTAASVRDNGPFSPVTDPRRPVARINRPRPAAGAPQRRRLLRVGLLGASFNPAHEGHLAISREALRRLALDRVWWLISPQNPLKPVAGMASFAERFASAQALAQQDPRIVCSDLEQRLATRYTVDTLNWLQQHGERRLVWLIGADNLLQLPQWHHWLRLIAMVPIAVFDREPYSHRASVGRVARRYAQQRLCEGEAQTLAERRPPAWVYLRLRRHQESSTAIRRKLTP